MTNTLTMRIKRVYFDQILNGTKRVEYRDCKPFYTKMFARSPDAKKLRLHYQSGRMLEADIDAINKIDTPDFFKLEDDGISFSEKTFAIILRNARLIKE